MLNIARNIQRQREASGEEGFTLIELLIVIVVLGILAAIVVFALGGITGQSAVAACNADAKTVSVGVSAFLAQNPTDAVITQANLVPTYLKSWPSNPSYYTISLGGTGANTFVQVALTAGTPGATATIAAGALAVGITAQPFEAGGSTATYVYPTDVVPGSLKGLGICAGA